MLEAKGLTCCRDERVLFGELSFRLAAGDIVQLEGANGAGKTSLLRILAGLALPDQGQVLWQQQPIAADRPGYQRDLLYIGHQAAIKAALTPFENLAFYQAISGARDSDAIWHALEQVGLLGYEELPAAGLSAGQQRRVALARLWLTSARLWILDEPLTAIDKQGVATLMQLFEQHATAGGVLLLTTHQPLPATSARVKKLSLTRPEASSCSA